jgi:hypothetical protein
MADFRRAMSARRLTGIFSVLHPIVGARRTRLPTATTDAEAGRHGRNDRAEHCQDNDAP